jgi:hypothetical protein
MIKVLRCTDPFIGNARETNKGTTSVARQKILDKRQLNKQQRNGVICAVRAYNRDGLGGTN